MMCAWTVWLPAPRHALLLLPPETSLPLPGPEPKLEAPYIQQVQLTFAEMSGASQLEGGYSSVSAQHQVFDPESPGEEAPCAVPELAWTTLSADGCRALSTL